MPSMAHCDGADWHPPVRARMRRNFRFQTQFHCWIFCLVMPRYGIEVKGLWMWVTNTLCHARLISPAMRKGSWPYAIADIRVKRVGAKGTA